MPTGHKSFWQPMWKVLGEGGRGRGADHTAQGRRLRDQKYLLWHLPQEPQWPKWALTPKVPLDEAYHTVRVQIK